MKWNHPTDPPRSWEAVAACSCDDCQVIEATRKRCEETGEPLLVCDVRMHQAGFCVVDIRRQLPGAAIAAGFPNEHAAADYVLQRQKHCDAIVSTWPDRHAGRIRWHRVELAPIPANTPTKGTQ